MHDFVFFNHQILAPENTFLSAISSAALYGKGIFTTVAIYNSKPFLWEKHWLRLTENSRQIGIDLSDLTKESLENSLLKIIAANDFTRGRARITIYDESASSVWQINSSSKTNLLIQTADFRKIKNKFNLTVSPFRVNSTSPLAGIKSCNYLENILAFEDAQARGFDEAIRLNECGEIVSACLANIFWQKSGAIYTPSLETGCLNGSTRSFVMGNFTVEERKVKLIELKEADEIFLTSAGIGIAEAAKLNADFENKNLLQ